MKRTTTNRKLRNMSGAIRGGVVGTHKALKAALKGGSGGADWLARVPDGSHTYRFLTEPEAWVKYWEHYIEDRDQGTAPYLPCTEDCEYCAAGIRANKRFLANVVDISESKVAALVLPTSVATTLEKKYNKNGTLMDRDYEITREGSGLDTEYDVDAEMPTRMNLARFDLIDLWAALEAQISDGDDTDDDDEDDELPEPVVVVSVVPI